MPEFDSTISFRDTARFPGYKIGSDGSLWSCWQKVMLGWRYGHKFILGKTWHQLRPKKLKVGYLLATLRPNMQYRTVHRLVLEAFIGPRPKGLECCHWDGDRANNHVSNLRWDTHKANCDDRKRHRQERLKAATANLSLCS